MLKIALIACSLLSLAGGLSLAAALIGEPGGSPIVAYFAAAAVLIQGGYTLFLLVRVAARWRTVLMTVFTTGEVGAAIVGSLALVSGIIFNLNPHRPECELGPMMLGAFMAAHAFVGLAWAARTFDFRVFARDGATTLRC